MTKEFLMRKGLMASILTLILVLSAYAPVMAAQTRDYNSAKKNYNVKVYIDDRDNPLTFPAGMGKPFIAYDRTFIPYRILAEKLGATVDWDKLTQRVTAKNAKNTVIMTIGKTGYTVNGLNKSMDVKPFILTPESRTYIPARYLTEGLGYEIDSAQEGTSMCITVFTEGAKKDKEKVSLNEANGNTSSSSKPTSSSDPGTSTSSSSSSSSNSSSSTPTVSRETSTDTEVPVPIADSSSYKIEGNHYIVSGDFEGVIETAKYIIEKQPEYIDSEADVITIYPQGIEDIQFTCTNHPELNSMDDGSFDEVINKYSIKGTGYAIPITKGMIIEIKTSDGDIFSITI